MRLILYGVESSYAADVLESMARAGIDLSASVLTGPLEWNLEGVGTPFTERVPDALLGERCLVPWVTPSRRKQRVDQALASGLLLAEALVDPTAVVPRRLSIGAGSYINARAALGGQCNLGHCVMVGRSASIGHHSTLDDYVSIGPGATLASKVSVGRGTLIGAGASVAPDIAIGSNSVVAAGAAVLRNLPDGVVAIGNPARIARTAIAAGDDDAI